MTFYVVFYITRHEPLADIPRSTYTDL